jgi:hypothetical protein
VIVFMACLLRTEWWVIDMLNSEVYRQQSSQQRVATEGNVEVASNSRVCKGQSINTAILIHPKSLFTSLDTDECKECKKLALWYKPEDRGFESRWGGFFFLNWPNPCSHTMALGSTRHLIEMITRNLSGE